MRVRGTGSSRPGKRAEVHLDFLDLRAVEAKPLHVTEWRASFRFERVAHERFATVREQTFNAERADALAGGPAPLEVGPAIDVVVVRTRENEIVAQQFVDCRAILLLVSAVVPANEIQNRAVHCLLSIVLETASHAAD